MEDVSKNLSNPPKDQHSAEIRVLVVEDHSLSAHIAERFLTDLGCQVDCVSDAATATKYFQDNQVTYHLILMDVSLPDMEGYALAKALREIPGFQQTSPPIVALTARRGEENEELCLEAGMKTVLVKPLLKTVAQDILKTYVPKWSKRYVNKRGAHAMKPWNITGKAIDFDFALEVHDGDIRFIKEALSKVVDNLIVELQELRSVCQEQRWDAGRVIIHKLQGGTRYFGLMRLDRVCEYFTDVLSKQPSEHWGEVYNLLISEVEKVRCTYEDWLKSSSL